MSGPQDLDLVPSRHKPEPMISTPAPAVSPTGSPIIPVKLAPYAAAVAAVAGGLLAILPEHTVAWKVCTVITGLAAALGIVSAGARK